MKQLYGLIGEKLNYSLSPQIHSLIFNKLKMDAYYHLFEVERKDMEDAICGLQALGIKGVNVTIPYKVEVMKYLHEVSKEAEKIGAVNTILIEGDKKTGYNTDYYGLKHMADYYNIPIKNKKALVLGTGGAAKAMVQFLLDNDIGDISIVSRYVEAARLKYQDLKILSYQEVGAVKNQDIIINCTPLGMEPFIEESPVDKELLSNYQWAIDLNYNPAETLFLKYAKEEGVKSTNGLFMLVGQALKAHEIWHKKAIPQSFYKDIYEEITSFN